MLDAVIIGAGPSGISCAIYLKRYGYRVLVVAKDEGALAKAHQIENYYGIPSISGKELFWRGVEQAKKLGIEVRMEEVVNLEKDTVFTVTTTSTPIRAKTVLIATRTSRNSFALGKKLEGKGVSYCATCDGFFYKKKKVALIGNGPYMQHELAVLENIVSDVAVFTDGKPLEVSLDDSVIVHEEKILALIGDDHLEGIQTEKGIYPVDGCFVALGSANGFTLAMHLGLAFNGNTLSVNEKKETNIKGLYAAGDTIGGLLQVSKAVADGAVAATSMAQYLKEFKEDTC